MLVASKAGEGLDAIVAALAGSGVHLQFVAGGEPAWQLLQAANDDGFDALIIDLEVDADSGMALLRRIRSATRLAGLALVQLLPDWPLADLAGRLREGLGVGASHFLARPFDPGTLLVFVRSAIDEARQAGTTARDEELPRPARLRGASFVLKTLQDAEAAAALIALAAPHPDRAQLGIAELLINAVEHGNLGITHAEKGRLKQLGGWHEEIERRAALPENRDKRVRVCLRHDGRRLIIRICDEGPGFDWREYLDFDPQRALDLHGRGIAVARLTSFDSLDYEDDGHIAVATIVDPVAEGKPDDQHD